MDIEKVLDSARIPKRYWGKRTVDYKPEGRRLRDYIDSDLREKDIDKGKVYLFHGIADRRVHLFHLFGKEMVLAGVGVFLCPLVTMVTCIRENSSEAADTLRFMDRVNLVMISNFYDSELPFPYTGFERALVEDFLIRRVEAGLSLGVSACKHLQYADWWSTDFRTVLSDNMRGWSFGKADRS